MVAARTDNTRQGTERSEQNRREEKSRAEEQRKAKRRERPAWVCSVARSIQPRALDSKPPLSAVFPLLLSYSVLHHLHSLTPFSFSHPLTRYGFHSLTHVNTDAAATTDDCTICYPPVNLPIPYAVWSQLSVPIHTSFSTWPMSLCYTFQKPCIRGKNILKSKRFFRSGFSINEFFLF